MKWTWKLLMQAAVAAIVPSGAMASQGPGVSEGTASPELQAAVIVGFVAFFVIIFLANIGRRR